MAENDAPPPSDQITEHTAAIVPVAAPESPPSIALGDPPLLTSRPSSEKKLEGGQREPYTTVSSSSQLLCHDGVVPDDGTRRDSTRACRRGSEAQILQVTLEGDRLVFFSSSCSEQGLPQKGKKGKSASRTLTFDGLLADVKRRQVLGSGHAVHL